MLKTFKYVDLKSIKVLCLKLYLEVVCVFKKRFVMCISVSIKVECVCYALCVCEREALAQH